MYSKVKEEEKKLVEKRGKCTHAPAAGEGIRGQRGGR